jgi:integrase/recombinase XerD
LFETNRGTKYTKGTIQKIVYNNSKNINNKIIPHTFRHSFATHLLESGNDVSVIQKLLGHSNIETTMIYVRVANSFIKKVNSPFDKLK